MDFYSLSRKELQTICKKNKIPANITNVAMADALSALPQVEGLDEILNPTEAETGAGTPDTTHRMACRTATRSKALRQEPQSAKVMSSQRPQRRTTEGNGDGGEAEQENKDANVVPITPAARRRATAVSVRRSKKEVVEDDEEKIVDHIKPADVTETPAAVPRSRTRTSGRSVCPKTNGTSVQRGYNTRRSVRLLEKNLSKFSLMDAEHTRLGKNDDVSDEMSVSQQIEDSANTEEVCDTGVSLQKVSNVVLEEADEVEVSSLEKKSQSEYQVVIDVGAEVEAEPQEEDSSLEFDVSYETGEVSCKVHDVSDVDMNISIEVEAAPEDNEAGSEFLSKSVEASEDASVEFAEQDVASLTVEVADDATDSLPISPGRDDLEQLKEVLEVDGKNIEAELLDVADDTNIQHFEPMNTVDDKAEDEDVKDLASHEGVLQLGSSDIYPSNEHQEEESEVKSNDSDESLAEVEEMDSASDAIGESSAIASEKDNANAISADSVDVTDACVESSADKSNNVENITLDSPFKEDIQEGLEAKPEHLEEFMGKVENATASDVTMALKNDASSEKSVGVAESLEDVTIATLESSLVDGEAELEEEKTILEAEAQPQESNEQAAEETILDGSSINSPALVEADAVSSGTVTIAPIHEAGAIPVQSVVAEKSKASSNETVPQMISAEENMIGNAANMKENPATDELHKKSMRELKMMLKQLSLDGKSNCKSKTTHNDNNIVKDVERKRTALKALPENQMTKGAAN